MFESVATARPSPRRRKAGALLLALVFVGAAASAVGLAGSQLVTELAEGPPIDVRLDEPMERERLGAPAAPAAVRRGDEDPGGEQEAPPEEAPTPTEAPSEPDGAASETADISNGMGKGPLGHPDGDPDGQPEGALDGEGAGGGGDGGGGLRSVHWTEVKVKRQAQLGGPAGLPSFSPGDAHRGELHPTLHHRRARRAHERHAGGVPRAVSRERRGGGVPVALLPDEGQRGRPARHVPARHPLPPLGVTAADRSCAPVRPPPRS